MKRLVALLLLMTIMLSACVKNGTEDNSSQLAENTNQITDTDVLDETKEGNLKVGGTAVFEAIGSSAVEKAFETKQDYFTKFGGSSTYNYMLLLEVKLDIIFVYEQSEEVKELINADDAGIEMTAIGKDALVFVGNKNNPVTNLTYEDVCKIYSNEKTNWKDFGGQDKEIVAFQKDNETASQTLFNRFINLGDKLMEAPSVSMHSIAGEIKEELQYNGSESSLGYTTYNSFCRIETQAMSNSKIFDYEGVTPSNETIASGEYKLSNDFYVVIRKDAPENSPERILYNWICSEQGKELIVKENYAAK